MSQLRPGRSGAAAGGVHPALQGHCSGTLPAETGGWLPLGKVLALVCHLELRVLFCLQEEVFLRSGPGGSRSFRGPPCTGPPVVRTTPAEYAQTAGLPSLRAPTRRVDSSPRATPRVLPDQVSLVGAEGGVLSPVSLERPLFRNISVFPQTLLSINFAASLVIKTSFCLSLRIGGH